MGLFSIVLLTVAVALLLKATLLSVLALIQKLKVLELSVQMTGTVMKVI